MTTPRKLSDVIPQFSFNYDNLIKAEELVNKAFVLQRGMVVETRFGPRCVFTITMEDGSEHTLLLALDDYRQEIIDALDEGPLGPATIVRRQGRFNHPYWLLTDAIE